LLAIEVYDPSYFVDFAFEEKDPVKAVGAPAQCKVSTSRRVALVSAAKRRRIRTIGARSTPARFS